MDIENYHYRRSTNVYTCYEGLELASDVKVIRADGAIEVVPAYANDEVWEVRGVPAVTSPEEWNRNKARYR